jgi:thiol-disulfide isomerase/thioredoxin
MRWIVFTLMWCFVGLGCATTTQVLSAQITPAVQPITAFDLHAIRKSSAQRLVLIQAWATWCPPCVAELPKLAALRTRLNGRGVSLLLVAVDDPDQHDEVNRLLGLHGVDFQSYVRQEPTLDFIEGIYPKWSGALPAVILYDGNDVVWFAEGDVTLEDMEVHVSQSISRARECAGISPGGVCRY